MNKGDLNLDRAYKLSVIFTLLVAIYVAIENHRLTQVQVQLTELTDEKSKLETELSKKRITLNSLESNIKKHKEKEKKLVANNKQLNSSNEKLKKELVNIDEINSVHASINKNLEIINASRLNIITNWNKIRVIGKLVNKELYLKALIMHFSHAISLLELRAKQSNEVFDFNKEKESLIQLVVPKNIDNLSYVYKDIRPILINSTNHESLIKSLMNEVDKTSKKMKETDKRLNLSVIETEILQSLKDIEVRSNEVNALTLKLQSLRAKL